jgi:general nucleoside transport system permease protein
VSDQPPPRSDGRSEDEPADGAHQVATATDEEREAEIAAAAEREGEQQKAMHLEAGFLERFVAAVTGTSVIVTLLAFVAAFVVGGVIIALSDRTVQEALGAATDAPGEVFSAAWSVIASAYGALLRGSLGGTRQLSETLVAATPLILTGLAVAVPLRAGLFNIGGEGQVIAGGMVAGLVGFSFTGLPTVLHLPFALLAGFAGGALYGWVPGILKARTGAHEVITTIMLNNIAILTSAYLLTTALFRQPDRTDPISQSVEATARLPRLLTGMRIDAGLIVALLTALLIFWLVERSTRGFELNAVGLNASAAASAGMNPDRTMMLAMTTGGALAGAGGGAIVLGVQGRITTGFAGGLGFEGITVALLGRGRIGGTVAAALLFGALRAGGRSMQAETGISLDLVLVIQALIIVFIAAPGLVRAIFRVKADELATGQVAKGWGA